MTGTLTPGEVAARSGFSLDTLRYYERIGLLERLERSSSGHRRFGEEDLEWLEVLRCLRDTGMPIAQMRQYAELARAGQATVAERLGLLTGHHSRVQERITLLHAQQEHLQEKINWYRSQLPPDPQPACPSEASTCDGRAEHGTVRALVPDTTPEAETSHATRSARR